MYSYLLRGAADLLPDDLDGDALDLEGEDDLEGEEGLLY